jgi:tripartite-type tricarboxylate transporter receptor subunit TctC
VVLYKNLGFDPTALEPVAIMSSAPNVLLVKGDFPAKTAQEFMAYVKANPGKLNYASQGPGTTSHLTAELFNKLTGAQLQHVPYKGTGPALNDIVAGHVDLIFMQFEAALKLHEGGKARILAVTTEKRIASLPEVPTMIELGLKDFVSDTWNAMAAPPKTPAPIIAKLNAAAVKALDDEGVRKRLLELGSVIPPVAERTPEALANLVKSEIAKWTPVLKPATN